MVKLDQASKKIIFELDRNSRTSYSSISRLTGVSQHTVRYRVVALVNDGVIRKFNTIIDAARLGYTHYKVLLRLQNASEQTISALLSFLMTYQEVSWLVRFEGPWDIGFTFRVRQMLVLSDFLEELSRQFGQYISARRIDLNISADYLTRRYLLHSTTHGNHVRHYASTQEHAELDATNKAILDCLQQDSRMSSSEIAKRLFDDGTLRVPISREAIVQRIRQMEAARVIVGYNMVLNQQALGQLHYKVMLSLNHTDPSAVSRFMEDCYRQPRIRYVVKTLGEADYELDLEVDSVGQYRSILSELKDAHPKTIRDHAAMIVTNCYVSGGSRLPAS